MSSSEPTNKKDADSGRERARKYRLSRKARGDVSVNVWLRKAVHEQLRVVAKEEQKTIADLIEEWIVAAYQQRQAAKTGKGR